MGIWLGVLAWIDSGMLLAGLMVLVIVGGFYGIWMHRRMVRYWPGARSLSGEQRVAVARAARRGESIADAQLAEAVIDYSRGMHEAADEAFPFRWVVPLVLVVGVATAVWDAIYGSWGNAVVSAIYLAMLLLERFWWPKKRQQLLANADQAAQMAAAMQSSDKSQRHEHGDGRPSSAVQPHRHAADRRAR